MKRKKFLQTTGLAVAALAAQGHLPLLAAERKKGMFNTHVEPSAIEPLTGYLPNFSPAAGPGMSDAFAARYELVNVHGATEVSRVKRNQGCIDVTFAKGRCDTVEVRSVGVKHTVKTSVQCAGKLNTALKWTLESIVGNRPELGFAEQGRWDGKIMTVQTQSRNRTLATSNPLIARWALLPLIASGCLKKTPLAFDLLDDSTLRPGQTLRYEGCIEVQVKGGVVNLDSYVQTGWGIIPTHYLVDQLERVQLITMSAVNWALKEV